MVAMRPVICLDLGGPAIQVANDRGIKVLGLNPNQTISDLADAMVQLAENPELRSQMGMAGRAHVSSSYTWDCKAEHYMAVYREALALSASAWAK